MVLANSGEGVSGEGSGTREGRVAASAATIAERRATEDFQPPGKMHCHRHGTNRGSRQV